MKGTIQWKKAALYIAGAELVGVLAFWFAGDIPAVYASLAQPPLSPPQWLFAVVWPVLYALMGFAAYLVYASWTRQGEKRPALLLYYAQLACNFLWTILFFRFLYFWLAAGLILLLDGLVYLTVKAFRRVSATAGALLVPYFLWLLFATYLNIAVAFLN